MGAVEIEMMTYMSDLREEFVHNPFGMCKCCSVLRRHLDRGTRRQHVLRRCIFGDRERIEVASAWLLGCLGFLFLRFTPRGVQVVICARGDGLLGADVTETIGG